MPAVEYVQHAGWAEVVLNRPEKRNAIDGDLGRDLAQAVQAAGADTACRLVLLRGAGGAFCSGLDLKAFNAEPPPPWVDEFQSIWRSAHRALFDLPVPLVCALERYAINGGAALALAADLLIVGEQAFLQVGEVQQGMAAPYNMAWLNLRTSENVRAQIALTGRRFSGELLHRLGLAYECVADADVLERSEALCRELADYPEGATRRIKAGMRAHVGMSADQWFDAAFAAAPSAAWLSPSLQKG